jgi:hypothetical protein
MINYLQVLYSIILVEKISGTQDVVDIWNKHPRFGAQDVVDEKYNLLCLGSSTAILVYPEFREDMG